jgi:predicted anti-sigma-YlaC factor YlaD
MTDFRPQPRICERAREWSSLRLDGELSELEQALLRAHLDRCASCRAYAHAVSRIAETIRTAEREQLPEPIALPSRRSRIAVPARALRASTAAAAVVAAAVGLGTLFGSLGGTSTGLSANAVRLSQNSIASGPSTDSDALIKAPRLAMLHAEMGVGKQRGIRIDV